MAMFYVSQQFIEIRTYSHVFFTIIRVNELCNGQVLSIYLCYFFCVDILSLCNGPQSHSSCLHNRCHFCQSHPWLSHSNVQGRVDYVQSFKDSFSCSHWLLLYFKWYTVHVAVITRGLIIVEQTNNTIIISARKLHLGHIPHRTHPPPPVNRITSDLFACSLHQRKTNDNHEWKCI